MGERLRAGCETFVGQRVSVNGLTPLCDAAEDCGGYPSPPIQGGSALAVVLSAKCDEDSASGGRP
jgi:hypothetical protein